MRDEWERFQKMEEQRQARGNKIKVEVKVEPPQPEADKPSGRKSNTWWPPKDEDTSPPGAKPEARRAKPRVTVKVEPEPEPENTSFGTVTGTATRVKDGLVYWFFVAKDTVVECAEPVSSFLGSFLRIFGVVRV